MARRTSIVALNQISEINMTPLIDLTFLLLITFIITFPMLEQGIPINLPRGKAQDVNQRDSRTISVNAEGALYLDNRAVSAEELTAEMERMGSADPETIIMVRGDETVAYGRVAEVMRILHTAKIARVALVTRAE
jgi:biopolymer transport protein TolR